MGGTYLVGQATVEIERASQDQTFLLVCTSKESPHMGLSSKKGENWTRVVPLVQGERGNNSAYFPLLLFLQKLME